LTHIVYLLTVMHKQYNARLCSSLICTFLICFFILIFSYCFVLHMMNKVVYKESFRVRGIGRDGGIEKKLFVAVGC